MVQEKIADPVLEPEDIPPDGEIAAFGSVPGIQSARYVLTDADKNAWKAAWELKVDRFGVEYGVPMRLPVGQLGYFQAKRRADGGRRFTLAQPANVLADPKHECFVGDCRKKVRERHQLVRHVEVCHQQEAMAYKPFLDQLRQAIIKDNPKLAALITGIAETPDQPIQAVSAAAPEAHGPLSGLTDDDNPQYVTERGNYACGECSWKPKRNAKSPQIALRMHSKTHRR